MVGRILPDLVKGSIGDWECYSAVTSLAVMLHNDKRVTVTPDQAQMLREDPAVAEKALRYCEGVRIGLEVPSLVRRLVEKLSDLSSSNCVKMANGTHESVAGSSHSIDGVLQQAEGILGKHKLPTCVGEEGAFVAGLKAMLEPGNKKMGAAAVKVVELQQTLTTHSAKHPDVVEPLIRRTKAPKHVGLQA